ncbi:Light-sensor Protein kinase [Peltigera leucophlebia]|nr:Light-sensor Protein kinase [Peltigera leucophlebia]
MSGTPTSQRLGPQKDSGLTENSTPPVNLSQPNLPAADHVFPMSSAVSLDPGPAPPNRGDGFPGLVQRFTGYPSKKSERPNDDASEKSEVGTTGSFYNKAADAESFMTTRFKHVMIEGGHAVIIGRDEDILQRCEDEPIHIPGAVQSFGVLVALQEEGKNILKVRVVSENSEQIIGYTPNQLFQLSNFCDILSEEQSWDLFEHIDFIRHDDSDPATNGPEIFNLVIRSPQQRSKELWCAIHRNGTNKDLIICEFELKDDPVNHLAPPAFRTDDPPEGILQSCPTAEEYAESTVKLSKPLRVLRSARTRKGEVAAMEVFSIISQVQEQLANATDLDTHLKVLVGVVKELTGFHRVMVYQFDQAWNGRVVTELVDTWASNDLYRGLNFPASDIPAQARNLYRVNKVRLLYDREQETSRLVCRTKDDLESPLDLTFSYLRAMSPIHVKYLRNMAVRASMSISIDAFNELWGLIMCHSYGSKGMRVSFPIRKMCRLIGESASRNIERHSYASKLQARKLLNTVPLTNPSGYIVASSEDLLILFDAKFAFLSINQETMVLGKVEKTQEALAMLEYLRLRKLTTVTSSTDIRIDFPDIRYAPGFTMIAGLLLVPLSLGGNDFIAFFRNEQTSEVRWAGNPYDKIIKKGTEGYLEPRSSFAAWSETVAGKCKKWTEEQIETSEMLRLVYGNFIEVWRQKEAVLQESKLTKLLLANSAHEVRTPLNAIINYLEIALEGPIDQETKEHLSKSHSASKSLVCVINDLLDLTRVEEGRNLIEDEGFDFPAAVREAVNTFVRDAKQKGIDFVLVENSRVPQFVIGDRRRVRQAISNVIANAIQNTSIGAVEVKIYLGEQADNHVKIDIVVEDTGVGMSAKEIDSLLWELEQIQSEGNERLMDKNDPANDGISANSKPLGLGLAQVGRIVRTMNGQLRLNSEEGKGSRFVITLRFRLPEINTDEPLRRISFVNIPASKTGRAEWHDTVEDFNSMTDSFKTALSGKSDADRPTDVLQESRRNSKNWYNNEGQPPLQTAKSSALLRISSGDSKFNSIGLSATSRGFEMPGEASVKGPKTPILPVTMPVRMPYERSQDSFKAELPPRTPTQSVSGGPNKPVIGADPSNAENLQILVAEDDPINGKIVRKRLEKIGHSVHLTINGEDCANAFRDRADYFDAVLMDIQMPIVDGLKSTKMIRSFENTHPGIGLSDRAACNGRVPVFAVSASLVEKDRQLYIDGGFDGWIPKPIDFKRLSTLLEGIVDKDIRGNCLYKTGTWERGGWFYGEGTIGGDN